jgi:hypothetical protein
VVRVFLRRTLVVGLAVLAAPRDAAGEPALAVRLAVRVVDPPPVSFDDTSLGRATHRVRVVFTNDSRSAITPVPLRFAVHAKKDGLTYPCDEPTGGERWPHRVEAKSSLTIDASVRCETPLPGRYELDVRARPRGAPEEDERSIATSTLTIEPGPAPPVRLASDGRLWIASSMTKEIPPAKAASLRIVVALINGSKTEVALPSSQAMVKVVRRGSTTPPCPPRTIDLAFQGGLSPGRLRSISTAIVCDLSAEGTYDVDLTLTTPTRVHLATHAVRALAVPLPHPGPTGTLPADLTP